MSQPGLMTGASRSRRYKRLVKVSANELQAQLNKAFLGLGLSTAAAADSSDMICCLELRGFDVIPLLPQTLELLTTRDQNDQSDTSPVSYLHWQLEEKTLVCDARGSALPTAIYGSSMRDHSVRNTERSQSM